ncbi:DNA-protecting protein DprA [Pseudoalteromonas sp. SR45-6]|uniref:DNA-processing protein DprA n=1 Tax=Pseudoalteromonas sp. SR45-6 TaxID=2760927 RepID=UPI0016003788|nr:DNA-processing protein DprA [Pseudoalteromonas sp. SR45-6]MBB1340034.1 DNA-protecting protein DprA [Pseudoalteromonas sp. SR45-6]
MDKELEYWKHETVAFLALQSICGVGFKTLYKIAEQKASFRELIKTEDINYFENKLSHKLDDSIKANTEQWMQYKLDLWAKGVELARNYTKRNISIWFYEQDYFPQQLKTIPEPPMWLFVEGDYRILHKKSVAIVGSRKASEDGIWLTKYIIASMVGQDLVSISGLADGIDQKAHLESIRYELPTIAVLGTGVESNYPRGSEKIRSQIVENGGAIVTEYLTDQSYSANNFIRRNRIQAALSTITVPVEWKIKSGTAHTVNFAKRYGKFLVMPYLYSSDLQTEEIQLIEAYKKGATFYIPQNTNKLIEFLQEPKSRESILVTKKENQLSMDL